MSWDRTELERTLLKAMEYIDDNRLRVEFSQDGTAIVEILTRNGRCGRVVSMSFGWNPIIAIENAVRKYLTGRKDGAMTANCIYDKHADCFAWDCPCECHVEKMK